MSANNTYDVNITITPALDDETRDRIASDLDVTFFGEGNEIFFVQSDPEVGTKINWYSTDGHQTNTGTFERLVSEFGDMDGHTLHGTMVVRGEDGDLWGYFARDGKVAPMEPTITWRAADTGKVVLEDE